MCTRRERPNVRRTGKLTRRVLRTHVIVYRPGPLQTGRDRAQTPCLPIKQELLQATAMRPA